MARFFYGPGFFMARVFLGGYFMVTQLQSPGRPDSFLSVALSKADYEPPDSDSCHGPSTHASRPPDHRMKQMK
jgi:hypothetical protein